MISYSLPATSANIGPGFDSFGIALQCYNRINVQRAVSQESPLPIFKEAISLFFEEANRHASLSSFPVQVGLQAAIPQARGLGSSATLRLGVLLALNKLTNSPLPPEKIATLATQLEGHADNVMAAFHGGFTMSFRDHPPVHLPISPELRFLLFIPDHEIATQEARKLLPKTITLAKAAANTAYGALIATAFAKQEYELLRGAFQDHLHQQYRTPLLPYLPEVLSSAEEAGALGGWLSGSGSTIAIVTTEKNKEATIEEAVSHKIPVPFLLKKVAADNQGATLIP